MRNPHPEPPDHISYQAEINPVAMSVLCGQAFVTVIFIKSLPGFFLRRTHANVFTKVFTCPSKGKLRLIL